MSSNLHETKETAKIVKQLREKFHAKILNLHGHGMQEANWPDIYIVHWQFRGWVEFKGPKTKLEPGQINIMRNLIIRGDTCYVARIKTTKYIELSNYNESQFLAGVIYENYMEAAEQLLLWLSKISGTAK